MEYELIDEYDNLINTLETEFDLNIKEARFSVFVLTEIYKNEEYSKDAAIALWHAEDNEKYSAVTPDHRYCIAFSDLKLKILKKAFVVIGTFFEVGQIGIITLAIELLLMFGEDVIKIDDEEYCVFSQIIRKCRSTGNNIFSIEKAIPETFKGECTYRSTKWECPYLRGDDCSVTEENTKQILKKLSEIGVLEAYQTSWKLKV